MAWQRGQSYSQDLRERVLGADELTARQAAARFAVSVSYVIKARQRRDRTGERTTKPRGYRRPERVAGLEPLIVREVEQRPSATLADLRAWLLSEHGVSLSMGTMWKAMRKLGLTLKKSRSAPPNRHARMSPPHGISGGGCSAG
jgi:transposase